MTSTTLPRVAAAAIALAAWSGIALYFAAVLSESGSTLTTLATLLRYFTIIANVLVAVLFTAVAAGWTPSHLPRLVAGIALFMLLVGVVYAFLLHGLLELSGGSRIANVLLHRLTPVLVPLFWLAFIRKGRLRWTDPLLWAILPLAYLPYALVRGAVEGEYAYPFINVGRLGWPQTLINAAAITVGFMVGGWALVGFDRWLFRRGDDRARR